MKDIIQYIVGEPSFARAPFINYVSLREKGFRETDLSKLDGGAAGVFDIRFLFTQFHLGLELYKQLGISEAQLAKPGFDLLNWLGFTEEQIEATNAFICGTMTIRGSAHLHEEHLAVFDCANRCGKKGKRFIAPIGHIRMMAAVQPFLSGAISKTVNLPNDADVDDISNCYFSSWEWGLKAIALYRDGCKLSQPLSTASKSFEVKPNELTEDEVLDAAKKLIQISPDTTFKRQLSSIVHRKRLPDRRGGFTQKAKVGGHPIFVRTGEYDDSTLGEILIDMPRRCVIPVIA